MLHIYFNPPSTLFPCFRSSSFSSPKQETRREKKKKENKMEEEKVGQKSVASLLSTLLSFSLLLPSPLPPKSHLLRLLRRLLLRFLLILLSFLSPPLRRTRRRRRSPLSPSPPVPSPPSAASRALSHLLSVVARVPVASRKYELVRSLADRLLDDNLRFGGERLQDLNREALSAAFSSTVRRLEEAIPAASGSAEMIVAAVRRWAEATAEEGGAGATVAPAAEKMAAEVEWLAKKMAECGAAEEAVARWGAAAELARVSIVAEPRLQCAFVRVSAFLFRHANAKQFGRKEGEEHDVSHYQMALLTSWLPLLCRASNGADAPTLSSGERAEMVRVLDEMIAKLSWEQQEEVLALWLHHFTSCPDSDWPNLESCYVRWYSESRDLILKQIQ